MKFKVLSFAVLVVMMISIGTAPPVHAQVPPQMSYQGVLLLDDGTVVADDSYQIRFEIFDTAAAGIGNSLFSQTLTVSVLTGLYSVVLSGPNLVTGLANPPAYLEVTIESGGTLSEPVTLEPRQVLTSVPYAFMAGVGGMGVPAGAIILWDQSSTCPENYEEVVEYRNLTIRGADSGSTDGDIPDAPAEACPGGTGCGAAAAAYDDTLDESEMPAHSHDIEGRESNGNLFPGSGHFVGGTPEEDSSGTELSGGDGPHYHPFMTVLFCRKI